MMLATVSGKDGTTFLRAMPGKAHKVMAPNVPSISVQMRGREVHVTWPQPLPEEAHLRDEAPLAELRLTLRVMHKASHDGPAGDRCEMAMFTDAPSAPGEHVFELPSDEVLLDAHTRLRALLAKAGEADPDADAPPRAVPLQVDA